MSTMVIPAAKTVVAALAEVRASKSGVEHFKTREEAEAFVHGCYDKFHPDGYGTSAWCEKRGEIFVVTWNVGSAD